MHIDQTYASVYLDLITEGLVIIDREGNMNAYNQAIEQMFGWPESELAGKPLSQLMGSEDYPRFCEQLEMLNESNVSQTVRFTAVRSNQEAFPATFTMKSLSSKGHDGFLITIKDLSEQELLKLNKEESEHRLRRESLMRHLAEVINESLDMHEILTTTASEVGKFFTAERVMIYRFLFHPDTQLFENVITTQYCANPEIAPITDEELREEAGNIIGLMSGLSWKEFGTYNQKNILKEVTNMTVEERCQYADTKVTEIIDEFADRDWSLLDGQLKYLEKQSAFLNRVVEKYKLHAVLDAAIEYKGLSYGKITLCDSNANRYWSEDEHVLVQFVANQLGGALAQSELYTREQKARQEAEVANRKKSEFLGMMSHELRTPLNAIIGFSDMTLKGIPGPLNEKQMGYIKNVHSSGKHLLDIVNDLLDISQIETGRLAIQPSRFELKPLLESIRVMMQEIADKRKIKLFFDIEPELDTLNADPARFKQILINLLNNAIKFNRDQGSVFFRLYPSLDQHWLIGEVEDTGMGIPQEKQANLFAKFYQVDSRIARAHEGTGLGLALTKELLDRHGGEIQVSSVEGQGSTFTFKLPLVAN